MRQILLLLVLLSTASAAAAQPGTRRPPADTIRLASPASGDSILPAGTDEEDEAEEDEEEAAATDSVPMRRAGPYALADGERGPFSVQASGEVAERPERGEVVWMEVFTPRRSSRDTAATRGDSARAGGRVTTAPSARRDSTPAGRTVQRDTASAGRTTRRDTASAPRTTPRDTTTRRTTSTPAPRDTIRPQTTPRRTTGGADARTHTVQSGETFFGIARRYGVTAAQLRAVNPDLDWEHIQAGDVLRLPASARDSRAAGSGGSQTRAATRTHTVAAGETLYGIARRYGVSVSAIQRANEMETDQVRVGQRLVIPPGS